MQAAPLYPSHMALHHWFVYKNAPCKKARGTLLIPLCIILIGILLALLLIF